MAELPRKTGTPARAKTGPNHRVRSRGTTPTNFTFSVNPTLQLVCLPAGAPVLFSLADAALLTGVHPELLRYYHRVGLIELFPGRSANELYLNESALQEVRRIEHYRRYLGVGRRALPLICELRREGERQQIELHFLRYP